MAGYVDSGCIARMQVENGAPSSTGFKVQIVSIKEIEDKMKQTRYRVQVTDGVESIYCMMSTNSAPQFKAKEMTVGSVISITNYQISPQAQTK
jgi:hypothetical protein